MSDEHVAAASDSGGRPVTARQIALAETDIGTQLARELVDYLALVVDATNAVGQLIGHVEDADADSRAIHAGAVVLARIVTDLQAVAHLVRLGYPAQALILTGSMQELMHTAAYIGADETRAEKWFSHEDPKTTYPPSLKSTIASVAAAMDTPAEAVTREYDMIYRQICMVKHGNTMAMGSTNLIVSEETIRVVAGPLLSDPVRRLAHDAMQYAVRYTLLTAIVFIRNHISKDNWASSYEPFVLLSDEQARLVRITAEAFPAGGETDESEGTAR